MRYLQYIQEAKGFGGMAGMGGIFKDLTKNRESANKVFEIWCNKSPGKPYYKKPSTTERTLERAKQTALRMMSYKQNKPCDYQIRDASTGDVIETIPFGPDKVEK